MEREAARQSRTIATAIGEAAQTSGTTELHRTIAAIAREAGAQTILVAAGQPQRVLAASNPFWLGMPLHRVPEASVAQSLVTAAKSQISESRFSDTRESFTYAAPVALAGGESLDPAMLDAAVAVRLDTRGEHQAVLAATWQATGVLVALAAILTALACVYLPDSMFTAEESAGIPERKPASDEPERELEHMTHMLADMASRVLVLNDEPAAEKQTADRLAKQKK